MSSTRAPEPDVVITHPNRDTAEAKATRVLLIGLMGGSALLVLIISLGGFRFFSGAQLTQWAIGLLFAYYTYSIMHWRSGILPIAAGTAVVSGIFALTSVSSWFERGGDGYHQPPLPEPVIGALVAAFFVLQIVNTVVAMRGFTQHWQVELEVPASQVGRGPLPA